MGLNPPFDGGSPAGHHLQWRPQSLPDPQGQHGHQIAIDLATQGFLRSALLQRSSTQLPTVFNPLLELAGFSQSSPDGEKARCSQLSMVHAIEWKDRLRKLSKTSLSLTPPSERYQCVGNLSQLRPSSSAIQQRLMLVGHRCSNHRLTVRPSPTLATFVTLIANVYHSQ